MTKTDQLTIIDKKIKVNQAQYNLDRLAAKIYEHSCGDLRIYEYLTGEDLGYRASVVEQIKFDYSPLDKVFNKGLDKDDQKEGIFKSLINIGNDKNKQSEAIKDYKERQSIVIKNLENKIRKKFRLILSNFFVRPQMAKLCTILISLKIL